MRSGGLVRMQRHAQDALLTLTAAVAKGWRVQVALASVMSRLYLLELGIWHAKQTKLLVRGAGALAGLQRRWPGRAGAQWVGAGRPFGALVYSKFTEQSYDAIWANYSYLGPYVPWYRQDFGKVNCSAARPSRVDARPRADQFWAQQVAPHACACFSNQQHAVP